MGICAHGYGSDVLKRRLTAEDEELVYKKAGDCLKDIYRMEPRTPIDQAFAMAGVPTFTDMMTIKSNEEKMYVSL